MRYKIILVALGMALLFGFFIGLGVGVTNASAPVETKVVVTETPEPEIVVDTTTQVVVEFPDACRRAAELAEAVSEYIAPVAESMGTQREVMSTARQALTGSNYRGMGDAMRMQTDLESELSGNYRRLSEASLSLEISLEECDMTLGN